MPSNSFLLLIYYQTVKICVQFCQVARLFNLEKDKVNLLTPDLHKFILQKRASLSGSSLDKVCETCIKLKCTGNFSM